MSYVLNKLTLLPPPRSDKNVLTSEQIMLNQRHKQWVEYAVTGGRGRLAATPEQQAECAERISHIENAVKCRLRCLDIIDAAAMANSRCQWSKSKIQSSLLRKVLLAIDATIKTMRAAPMLVQSRGMKKPRRVLKRRRWIIVKRERKE